MRTRSFLLFSLFTCWMVWNWTRATEDVSNMKKWQRGKGWGWVWGKDDEIGALNEMTGASRLAAVRLVEQGRIHRFFQQSMTYTR